MSSNFSSLPSEIRNRIYELRLVHEEPIDPWDTFNRREQLSLGLLCASKAIHREASSLFYAQNRFDFTTSSPEQVASFLEQIGSKNAACIQHVYVDFPNFAHLDAGNVTLEEDDVSCLAKIRGGCVNLSMLTTPLNSTMIMLRMLDNLDSPEVGLEALKLVDTHFRTISSLQELVVEVSEDGLSDHLREEMESHKWTISTREHIDEGPWDDRMSDPWGYDEGMDDGYDYDHDDYDHDDYDIDNDSDFWRRAGD